MTDRFRGCLIGTALGDAIGLLVEKSGPEEAAAFLEEGYWTGGIRAAVREHGNIRFGQYSDDTQFSRELMLSLAECGGWDPADFARRVAALFAEGRVVGAGGSSRRAAQRLIDGVPWHAAGEPAPMAGNGAAMRAAPVGLFFADPARAAAVAREQGSVTHADPRSLDSAAVVALAAWVAARHGELSADGFLRRLREFGPALLGDCGSAVLGVVESAAGLSAAAAMAAIRGMDPEPDPGWPGASPYGPVTVGWSLWCFLANLGDWEAAVLAAVRGGGDTDTTAAITGALAGCRGGLGAIPPRYVDDLNDRGGWRAPRLLDAADACWAAARRGRA